MLSPTILGLLSLVLGRNIQARPLQEQDSSPDSNLPVVDLGYTRQAASSFNASGGYYNFTNIRYGEPPVGDLRFAAPVPVKENRTVQYGGQERICMQANPAWTLLAAKWLPVYTSNSPSAINAFQAKPPVIDSARSIPPMSPYETEDCLFLDVSVPASIYAKRNATAGAPVMVWIFGGGFAFGSKNYWGSGAGLLERSDENMIYVTINYRLGAFGWLSGPTFEASNGTSNAGLLDQRLALEWVQKHIHVFGGDPKRVSVVGESAGGASIMHHITAYGGTKAPAPFQQAITQSAAWLPVTADRQEDSTFNNFLAEVNATTLKELRNLPLAVGLRFTSPFIKTNSDVTNSLAQAFPQADNATINYVTQTLYPDNPSGNNSEVARAALITAESTFSCNTRYLSRAFGSGTYNYIFAIPPGLHGQDIPYTFYNGGGRSLSVARPEVAIQLQKYITNFVITGKPDGTGKVVGTEAFDSYGTNGTVKVLGMEGTEGSGTEREDPTKNARCDWWQAASYARTQ
ncbi:hypothetical protein Q9189_006705 [Teloschistes chrysophthalmus]